MSRTEEIISYSKWKPSDRELDAILTVIGDERQEDSDVVKELLKIYHHLKKLREEQSMTVIEIFGRKLTIVEDNADTCEKCALVDICPSWLMPCEDVNGNVNRIFEQVKG